MSTKENSPNPAAESNCQLCNAPDAEDNMVACDRCDLWFHYMCAGVDSFITTQDFLCRSCAECNTSPNIHSTPTASEHPPPSTETPSIAPFTTTHQSAVLESQQQIVYTSVARLSTSRVHADTTIVKEKLVPAKSAVTCGANFIPSMEFRSASANPMISTAPMGTKAEGAVSKRQNSIASSKNSKNSKNSNQKRLEIELQRLEEERAMEEKRNQEESELRRKTDMHYIHKKFQLINQFAEDSSGSDDEADGDDVVSTKTNSKVQEWLKQTNMSSQVYSKGDNPIVTAMLNPKGHNTNVNEKWLGANVIPPHQQQQQRTVKLSQDPVLQPQSNVQRTMMYSSALPREFIPRADSQQPTTSRYNQNGERVNTHCSTPHHLQSSTNLPQATGSHHHERNGETINFPQPPLQPQPPPSQHHNQLEAPPVLTRNQIAARHSILKDLPIFGGDPEDWPLFISSFERTTQICGFSEEENLIRLQRVLKDQALKAVQSLLYQPSCVPRVIATLKMMFGRPELILNSLHQKIQATPPPKVEKLETLVNFAIAVQNLCATLEASGLVTHLNNPTLLQELIEKLPSSIRLNWALYRQTLPTTTLSEFSVWLYQIAEAANCVIIPGPSNAAGGGKSAAKKEKGFLHAHSEVKVTGSRCSLTSSVPPKCPLCNESCSSMDKCTKFVQLNHSSKWNLVRDFKLCRRCLKRHGNVRCRSDAVCGKNGCIFKHHQLLHNDQKDAANTPEVRAIVQQVAQPSNSHIQNTATIMYRIIPVVLHGNNTELKTYAFLDEGSSLTLMDEEIATQLNVAGTPDPLCIKWTANAHRFEDDSQVINNIHISGTDAKSKRYPLLNVHTVKALQLPLQSLNAEKLKGQYRHLQSLPLESYTDASPRLLIGLNNWKVGLPLKCKEGKLDEPVAAKTRLGWTIHGCYPHLNTSLEQISANTYSNFHMCECSYSNDTELTNLVKEFLCTDNFGTTEPTSILRSPDDQRAMDLLQNNTQRKNGRFETGLLWKYDDFELPDSHPMAKRRLICLQRRMHRDPELAKELHQKIESYISKGYARKLTPKEVAEGRMQSWYLPIFPVRNPNKPGKLRLVWDAAAKVGGVCLNSVLLKGPDLLVPLTSVIFKFREKRFAICADIQEMFHQIRVREPDQSYQRFLWFNKDTGEVEEYVLMVLTFGATCSPSCAQFIKNKNADEFERDLPRAAQSIRQNHYVDDLMDSVDSEDEAVELAKQITFIHQQGGFHIRNWISNSVRVIAALESEPTDAVNFNTKTDLETEKVLGMWWCTQSDCFTFRISSKFRNEEVLQGGRAPTKREVLRILMQIFDPLGLLANFLMYVKILLQEVWRTGIDWDEQIAEPQHKKWLHWTRLLPQLEGIRIPRCYISKNFTSYPEMELHTFVDASENGFAAVAYVRSSLNGLVECSLIGARTKVAPLKLTSIPRLELQAAVLGVRLAKRISESHSIKFHKRFFWTDSKTVLSWFRSDHRRYRQFVAFRVSEVLEYTNIREWRWISTKFNVADEATKWQKNPNFNPTSPWFKGPSFLMLPSASWPQEESPSITSTEEELKVHFTGVHCGDRKNVFDPERYSNWTRLLHCAAGVTRFVSNIRASINKNPRTIGPWTRAELQNAERALFRQAQWDNFAEEMSSLSSKGHVKKSSPLLSLCPHIDENGVLRARSRIERYVETYADIRRPIILPRQHPVTNLIVKYYHHVYHHGNHETVINQLRQRFHIPKMRTVLWKVRKGCQLCKNAAAIPRPPMMAQLPVARLSSFCRPFSFTGIDYFGPMCVVNLRRTEKRYGVLLTCLTTRAIHLEIAHSMTTDSCILAIRNFMARRGTPIEIFSDNGTNFKGAERELKKAYQNINVDDLMRTFSTVTTKWTFIPPGSPHMGGSWERLVRSVKSALYQIHPCRNPSDELLRSMLMEVENIVNSRPLTYMPIDHENEEALTPSHFLVGSSDGSKPWTVFNSEKEILRQNWRISQQYAQQFWRRWVHEYLPTITRRTKWFAPAEPIKKGDVVLIVDPCNPRNSWPKGRVIQTKLAKDGQVRSATVLTRTGIYERPAVKLAVLDVKQHDEVGPPPVDIPGESVADAHP